MRRRRDTAEPTRAADVVVADPPPRDLRWTPLLVDALDKTHYWAEQPGWRPGMEPAYKAHRREILAEFDRVGVSRTTRFCEDEASGGAVLKEPTPARAPGCPAGPPRGPGGHRPLADPAAAVDEAGPAVAELLAGLHFRLDEPEWVEAVLAGIELADLDEDARIRVVRRRSGNRLTR